LKTGVRSSGEMRWHESEVERMARCADASTLDMSNCARYVEGIGTAYSSRQCAARSGWGGGGGGVG